MPLPSITPRPRISLLAMGGTIASFGADETATIGYKLDPARNPVIEATSGLASLADIRAEVLAHLPSHDISVAQVIALARRIASLFAEDVADGVVVSHGTDTLEESAYLLDLMLPHGRPVVLTGAMRPASALSADGPLNLFNAVRLAAHPQAARRGVLVCLNDRIGAARSIAKMHTSAPDAFHAPDAGFIGRITGEGIEFFGSPLPTGPHFPPGESDEIPIVEIIFAHLGMTAGAFDAALEGGAAGLVIAGTGNGSVAEVLKPSLARAREAGVPVIRASRVAGGSVSANVIDLEFGCLPAGPLSPQKARLLLLMTLRETHDIARIAEIFRSA
jgi:L-asparaginase